MPKAQFSRELQSHLLRQQKKYGNAFKAVFTRLILIGFVFCFGCSGANYGGLKHSRDVRQAFETYHVYPEHRYYYLHTENDPYAVVALYNSYTISDRQWTEFDPQTDKLEKLVDLVKKFPVNYSNAYGSYLMDSSGNQIGYWYSSLRINTLKVDNEAQKVSIYTDTPWLRDDDRGFGTGIGVGIGAGGAGIGIRQVIADDPMFDNPELTVITEKPIPRELIDRLLKIAGVHKVVVLN